MIASVRSAPALAPGHVAGLALSTLSNCLGREAAVRGVRVLELVVGLASIRLVSTRAAVVHRRGRLSRVSYPSNWQLFSAVVPGLAMHRVNFSAKAIGQPIAPALVRRKLLGSFSSKTIRARGTSPRSCRGAIKPARMDRLHRTDEYIGDLFEQFGADNDSDSSDSAAGNADTMFVTPNYSEPHRHESVA